MDPVKILYVEDDPLIAEIYSIMISDSVPGAKIDLLDDPKKSIEAIKKDPGKYHLIISDQKLINGTGGEIFKFVNGQMLGIPFILLTGFDCTNEPDFKNFFDSHVRNAVLMKPVEEKELSEKIHWCLEEKADLVEIYNKEKQNFDEKISVGAEAVLRLNVIPCDVYLKLRDGKYVKIINKEQVFERKLIEKLIVKGVRQFFVNRSELSNYGNSVFNSLTSNLKLNLHSKDKIKQSQINSKAINVVKMNLMKCGFSEASMEAVDQIADLQLELIKSTPALNEFLEKFQLFAKSNADHTRIVNYISVAILKELSWDSESTLEKMSLTVLLHDISLPERFFNERNEEKYDENDKKIFLRHPEDSAHIAKNFSSIGMGIDKFILEHHELPDGKGFPKKINYNNIHPMSAVLHLADRMSDIIWSYDYDMDKANDELKSLKSFYSRGFYRKPYDALCRVFKI